MTDITKFTPGELRAAMTTGTDNWARHGSTFDHARYCLPSTIPARKRRMCRCGCRKKSSHMAMVNGVALGAGCEFWVRRWVKNPRDAILSKPWRMA
jgi:hypothetical protein